MPDEIDLGTDDQGLEDQGTVDAEPDLALPDDQGADDSVQSDEGDGGYPFDPIDEATESLLHTDPSRGVQILRDRLLREQKNRDKTFTKRMTKLKEEMRGAADLKGKWDQLDKAFTQVQQQNPDLFARFVAAMKGEQVGPMNSSKAAKKPKDFDEFWGMLDERLNGLKSELRNEYMGDQITREADMFIRKHPSFKAKRDEIIRIRSANPDLSVTQAAAAVDPKLFTSVARRATSSPPPDFGVNERTAPSRNTPTSLKEAMEMAIHKHGDPDRAPPG